jgi:hypothetical protein
MPCETVEIAEQIGALLAHGTGPTKHWPKKTWDILFCPITLQAAEIIGSLFATEWQSHKVIESQTLKGTQYMGGWNFFVPDFNKLIIWEFSKILKIQLVVDQLERFLFALKQKQNKKLKIEGS